MNSREQRPSFTEIVTALGQPEIQLHVDQRIGSYQLKKKIGSGQFGEVWLAVNTEDDSNAAVKVFSRARHEPDALQKAAERFWSGAIAMRKLRNKSKHIVQLLDGPAVQGSLIWFAMEYFPKGDLATRMSSARLPVTTIVQLMSDVLEALRVAHGSGIVHRDVRPRNILLRQDKSGRLRGVLCDFDIAYFEDRFRQRSRTRELAEDRYLPPDITGAGDELVERLRRASNDLYALAAVTLDLLTSPKEIPLDSSEDRFRNGILERQDSGLDADACAVFARFLSHAFMRVERERYQTVAEYARDWSSIADRHGGATNGSGGQSSSSGRRSYRHLLSLVLLAAILVVAILIILDWAYYRDPYSAASKIAGRVAIVSSAVLSVFFGVVKPARDTVIEWLSARPRLPIVLRSLTVAVTIAALLTRLDYRIRTSIVKNFDECIVMDTSRNLVHILRDIHATPIDVTQRVACAKCTVDGLSRLTPVSVPEKSEYPGAFVSLEGIGHTFVQFSTLSHDRGAATEPGKLMSKETLDGVIDMTPLAARAIETALGLRTDSLRRVELTVGYPKRKVRITVERQDLGRLLLRAGLAAADAYSEQSYRDEESDAKRAGRGRWATEAVAPAPSAPPFQLKNLTVLVERGPRRSEDGLFGYYYRFEASPEVMELIESIQVVATRRNGDPLNGPLAYMKCHNGTGWALVSDDRSATRTTCNAKSLHAGCECRLVLTSERCAAVNKISVVLTGKQPLNKSFNACTLVGEHLKGPLDRVGRVFLLTSTESDRWEDIYVNGKNSAQCGSLCGPPLARVKGDWSTSAPDD